MRKHGLVPSLSLVVAAFVISGCFFSSAALPTPVPTSTGWLAATLTAIALAQPSPTIGPTEPPLPPAPTDPFVPTGKIVLTCRILGAVPDQLCIVNADGTDYHRITFTDQAESYYPSLAPDGRSVVYTSNLTAAYEIYEMDLSTGLPVQLTNLLGEVYAPEISPDGQRIVFANIIGTFSRIWMMDRDGSHPHEIFGLDGKDCVDPTWSPDGTRILFAAGIGTDKQLFTITPTGEDLVPVHDTFRTRGRSDWSSDGSIIAAYSWRSPGFDIFYVDPGGSNLRQMTSGGRNLAPSFSPDSRWMVYTSYAGENIDPDGCELFIMPVDGNQIIQLTHNSFCDWQPRWGR
jgi:TolB protein